MLSRSYQSLIVAGSLGITLAVASSAEATWSVAAVDADARTMGGAVASCVGGNDLANVVGFAPNRGIVIAQAYSNMYSQSEAIRLLGEGYEPKSVMAAITDPAYDFRHRQRQFAIVTVYGEHENFDGAHTATWSGHRSGRAGNLVYAAQGNILTGEDVVANVATAMEARGACDLAERLLLGLEAGGVEGEQGRGDARCIAEHGTPSNSAALVVRTWSGENIVDLSVAGTGENSAVPMLRAKFEDWRKAHACNAAAQDEGGGCTVAGRSSSGFGATALVAWFLACLRRVRRLGS